MVAILGIGALILVLAYALHQGYNSKVLVKTPLLTIGVEFQRDLSQLSPLDKPNALECESLDELK